MRRAFVTGGSGFVGRGLLEGLAARGVPAVALARSDAAAAACAGRGARVVRGDLDDEGLLAGAMQGCDVVFHCAAHVVEWDDPAIFNRVNVEGTARVLAAARQAGVARLVHVSTEATLVGGGPIVQADETRALPERPLGMYPASKAAAERLVRDAAAGLHTVIVRPRFVWGAGDTSLLPQIMEAVRTGRFKWISGGRHLTSTCHVRNLIEGMLLAAERGARGEAYFLTDGPPVEFRKFLGDLLATQGFRIGDANISRGVAGVVAAVGEAVGKLSSYRWRPPITRMTLKLFGEEVTVRDDRARRELGYVGRVSREEGLDELRRARAATVS